MSQLDKKTILAICYDFDKTLSPDDMQAQGYIQSVGYNIADFWKESSELAHDHEMDQNLAYMYKMMDTSQGKVLFTKDNLKEYGAKVSLFPGVETWFERINEYGEKHDVIIEHYIISSGLKEMIEGTTIAKAGVFKKIYASSFLFNDRGLAVWPAQAINYTNKTQFLFRIQKGTLDINDPSVNDFFAPEEIRIPFRNIVYIGDSDTDIPCMKLVNTYGGHSIGVYNCDTKDKTKVYRMTRDNRIKFFAPADYTEGAELDVLVKDIVDRTVANEKLELTHYNCKKEYIEFDENNSEEAKVKRNLISDLSTSKNFEKTHALIKQLQEFDSWSESDKNTLFEIGINNHPVYWILNDTDVKLFYSRLLKTTKKLNSYAQKIKDKLEQADL